MYTWGQSSPVKPVCFSTKVVEQDNLFLHQRTRSDTFLISSHPKKKMYESIGFNSYYQIYKYFVKLVNAQTIPFLSNTCSF